MHREEAVSAFYVRDGDGFIASPYTRGPWSDKHQHGGPPAALLARATAAFSGADFFLARLTVEFLRPVPVGRVALACELVRDGSKVQRLTHSRSRSTT